MILNVLQKTCVNNRTVLKCSPMAEQIFTSQKCYATSTISVHQKKRYGDKISFDRLYAFGKNRSFLTKFGKYESSSSRKFNVQERFNPQFIQNLKLMDWSLLTTAEKLEKFKNLSINAMHINEVITNKEYKKIISELTLCCWKFNDNQLHTLLKCLELWSTIVNINRKNHAHELLQQIDNELEKRSNYWNAHKTLMFCDTICRVYNFHSKFVSNSLTRLMSNPSTLTHTNIVQIMYYLFIYSLPEKQIRQLEPYIEDFYDQFEIEELGIICLGFFGSQVPITSQTLLCKIMQTMIENINEIKDNELGILLKLIRYSFISRFDCVNTGEKLLETIIQRVPCMTTKLLTQLVHFVADSQLYNQTLLTAITERFTENIKIARLKDIERMLLLMTTFNFPPSHPLYDLIIEELRSSERKEEISRFPKVFGFALKYLALANIYPHDLIAYIMSRENIISTYGHSDHALGIEYLVLDQSIKIEVPDYRGPMLQEKVCKILAKNFEKESKYSHGSKAKQEIVKVLNNAFGCKNSVCLQRILPHFLHADVIICLDEDKAIPPMPILKGINSLIKYVPKELRENKKWIAIIFASETLLIRKTQEFSGNLCAKIRQLKKVGFIPIVVPYNEWRALSIYSRKWEYLKKKIFECNDSQEKCALEA